MKFISVLPITNLYLTNKCENISDQLYFNDPFTIIKNDEFCYYIKTSYNYYGYIKKDSVVKIDTQTESLTRQSIIGIAYMFLHTPYVYGGKSYDGIDCSGLTSLCYLLCDIFIYRDAILDKTYVKTITKDQLKPADLLFSEGHIMLYIGDNKYIHASKSVGHVVINSLDNDSPIYRDDIIITNYATAF